MNQTVFDDILETMTRIFIDGFLSIHPTVMLWLGALLMAMIVISAFLAVRFINHPIVLVILGAILFRAFTLFTIANNWDTLTDGWVNAVVYFGLRLGQENVMTPGEFLSPGRFFFLGAALSQNLLFVLVQLGSDWYMAPVLFLVYWFGMQILWAVWALMGITVMLCTIEYRLLVVYGFLLWPLMTVSMVGFLAETLAAQILYAGLRLAALATILGVALNFAVQVAIPEGDTTVTGALSLTWGMLALLFIVWVGPRIFGSSAWPGSGLIKIGILTWMGTKRAAS